MPGGDRTGPVGAGPMTGRGAGFCAGYGAPGYANPGFGRGGMGFGHGRGFGGGGRGWRHRFYATGQPGWVRGGWGFAAPAPMTGESELAALKQEAEFHDRELAGIRARIEELEKAGTKD